MAEELVHEVVDSTASSGLASPSDSLALGQTDSLGAVSETQLTVPILDDSFDPHLWASVLDRLTVPRGTVSIGCILVMAQWNFLG